VNPSLPARDIYFYLSHARAPSMPVDYWVRKFYDDLCVEVEDLARLDLEMEVGFADFMPPGGERDSSVSRAINAARVLVPLYSPDYLTWPLRERATFLERLGAADEVDPHIQPVIWVPGAAESELPDVAQALELGEGFPDYAQRGLATMCRLKAYEKAYRAIVRRLAERVVEVAEQAPLEATTPRTLLEVSDPATVEIPFIIAVVAPIESRLPVRRSSACYGSRSMMWRPFRNSHEVPVADYTSQVARKFMLPTRIVDFAAGDNRLDTSPGVILVDPWVLAREDGKALVRAAFEALRQWVTLVVVVDRFDPQYDEIGSGLANDAMRLGASGQGHKLARDANEFEHLIGKVVARTRRQYLSQHSMSSPDAREQ
jgi:FxsC-like protein